MKEKANKETPQAAPQVDGAFLRRMQNHRKGEALSDLSEALRKCTEAVLRAGKPGTVVLKLKIKPASKGVGALVVTDEVDIKVPKPEERNSMHYVDYETFDLVREDPNQQELELKSVPAAAEEAPLKKVVSQ